MGKKKKSGISIYEVFVFPLILVFAGTVFEFFFNPFANFLLTVFEDNPKTVVQEYFTNLNNGNSGYAYALLSKDNKQELSKSEFEYKKRRWKSGTIKSIVKEDVEPYNISVVSVDLDTISNNKQYQHWKGKMFLVKEDGGWKIYENALTQRRK